MIIISSGKVIQLRLFVIIKPLYNKCEAYHKSNTPEDLNLEDYLSNDYLPCPDMIDVLAENYERLKIENTADGELVLYREVEE